MTGPISQVQTSSPPAAGLEGIQPQSSPELGQVKKTSGWAIAGRVILGILTLGISEGIRAIVRSMSTKPAAEPRIDREPATRTYTSEDIKEGLSDQINAQLTRPLSQEETARLDRFGFREISNKVKYLKKDVEARKLDAATLPERHEKIRSSFVRAKVEILNHIETLNVSDRLKGRLRFLFVADTQIKDLAAFKTLLSQSHGLKAKSGIQVLANPDSTVEQCVQAAFELAREFGPKNAKVFAKTKLSGGDAGNLVRDVLAEVFFEENPQILKNLQSMPADKNEEVRERLCTKMMDTEDQLYVRTCSSAMALLAAAQAPAV